MSTADRDVTEHRITVMLISVVVVFLVCQLPQAVQKLYTVYLVSAHGQLTTGRSLRLAIGANFCNLLVIVNSAVNFILYSALSAKFRHTFRQTFCCSRQWRCRGSASVIGTMAVPLSNTLMMDGDHPGRRHRPRVGSTDSTDKHVTCGRSQTLLDGDVDS